MYSWGAVESLAWIFLKHNAATLRLELACSDADLPNRSVAVDLSYASCLTGYGIT